MLKVDSHFFDLQIFNENKLKSFLDFTNRLVCNSCYTDLYPAHNPHNRGAIQYLLSLPPKIEKQAFEKWKADVDHGFLHGLIVAYFTFCFTDESEIKDIFIPPIHIRKNYKQKEFGFERMFYSCLFHDFYKSVYESEPHDKFLIQYFPQCQEETYNHANPIKESPIVISDRLELARYKDHKKWCDMSKLENGMKTYGVKEFNHFYRHIRPLLEDVILFQNDVWVSHTAESKHNTYPPTQATHRNLKFYPEEHWIPMNLGELHEPANPTDPDLEKYLSVYIGKLPLRSCHLHHIDFKKIFELDSLIGMISKSKITKLGNEIVAPPNTTWGRDHPFLKQNNKILIEDWIFLYQEEKDLNLLRTGSAKILSSEIFNLFWDVTQKLLCKIEALKVS